MYYLKLVSLTLVFAAVLSQRNRQQDFDPISLPARLLSFPGARQVSQPDQIEPQRNVRPVRPANRQRIQSPARSRPQPAPRISLNRNPAFTPVSRPSPKPIQLRQEGFNVFQDEDLDYFDQIGFNDPDYVLNEQNQNNELQNQQSFQPAPVISQITPQAPITPNPLPAPVRTAAPLPRIRVSNNNQRQNSQSRLNTQTNSAPRRGPKNNFKHEFRLQQNIEEGTPRGRNEPTVQIVKSWSNRNSDGTFSYGYINSDGSFKNETKGVDCVVRGVYGYVDETGETRSYPYESGNPCDPNEPDYYYDYQDALPFNTRGQQQRLPALDSNSRGRLQ